MDAFAKRQGLVVMDILFNAERKRGGGDHQPKVDGLSIAEWEIVGETMCQAQLLRTRWKKILSVVTDPVNENTPKCSFRKSIFVFFSRLVKYDSV